MICPEVFLSSSKGNLKPLGSGVITFVSEPRLTRSKALLPPTRPLRDLPIRSVGRGKHRPCKAIWRGRDGHIHASSDVEAVFDGDGRHGNSPLFRPSFRTRVRVDHEYGCWCFRGSPRKRRTLSQADVGVGRYRRITPMITTTKNTSTMPWTMANGGSAGGTLGASACSAGTFRKDWITSTNTLR